jgi:hypothetical protein
MHCPGPGQSHKIQKMAGYTVLVWVILVNDTVYQSQQFARVSGSVTQYTGNGWDALPRFGSVAQNTENGGIHCAGVGGSGKRYSVSVATDHLGIRVGCTIYRKGMGCTARVWVGCTKYRKWWDTLYRSGWSWRTIQCISCNSSPGCPGRSHNIQEMDGMHCPGPGRSHKIQKMAGYTVLVWVVLANNTVYQSQQFAWVSGSDT